MHSGPSWCGVQDVLNFVEKRERGSVTVSSSQKMQQSQFYDDHDHHRHIRTATVGIAAARTTAFIYVGPPVEDVHQVVHNSLRPAKNEEPLKHAIDNWDEYFLGKTTGGGGDGAEDIGGVSADDRLETVLNGQAPSDALRMDVRQAWTGGVNPWNHQRSALPTAEQYAGGKSLKKVITAGSSKSSASDAAAKEFQNFPYLDEMTPAPTRYGIEDIQFRPHVVELYRSGAFEGSNLEDFVCSRHNFDSVKTRQNYPGPMLFTPLRKDPEKNTSMLWRLSTYPGDPGSENEVGKGLSVVPFKSRIMHWIMREALEYWHWRRKNSFLSAYGHALNDGAEEKPDIASAATVKDENGDGSRDDASAVSSSNSRGYAKASASVVKSGISKLSKPLGWARDLGRIVHGAGHSVYDKFLGPKLNPRRWRVFRHVFAKTALNGRDLFEAPHPQTVPTSRKQRDLALRALRQKQRELKQFNKLFSLYYYRLNPRLVSPPSTGGGGAGLATNLVTENKTKKMMEGLQLPGLGKSVLSTSLAEEPKHPWVKLSQRVDVSEVLRRPYIHVTLEDKTAGQILWDAVYNMRNQVQFASDTFGGRMKMLFNPTKQAGDNEDASTLHEKAAAIHGVQKRMIKICPRQSDLVPRTYSLTVKRWPSWDEQEDFIGKALYQSYQTVNRTPERDTMARHLESKKTYGLLPEEEKRFAKQQSANLSERLAAAFTDKISARNAQKAMQR
ncbi:unnamed protein product [Amoebophrya sp. A25]|nr:unnamed protein product [Amoebophrya sp. A25]|eukprot:GSA25T00011840001.1